MLNNIVLLIGDLKLFFRDPLDRIIDPLLAVVISIDKTLLLAEDLVALLRAVAV